MFKKHDNQINSETRKEQRNNKLKFTELAFEDLLLAGELNLKKNRDNHHKKRKRKEENNNKRENKNNF